jgi:hypothetical protein
MELFRDEEETGRTEREETGVNRIMDERPRIMDERPRIMAQRPRNAFGFDTSYRAGEGITINPMGYNREQPINYPQIYAIVERDSRMPVTAYTSGFRPYGNLSINLPMRPDRRDTDTGATII